MSFKIYPVTKTEISCDDYSVKINGEEVKLNTARVSACPFNRRWPGHQRGMEQSELINFLSLCTDEILHFEIKVKKPFDKANIRPLSLGIKPEIDKEGVIRFTLEKNAYFTVEPFGRNNALHIFADTLPEYNINKNNDDVIYYGAGEHNVGLIELKSNQTLFIDEGAVVYANVKAVDADNIKILGRGILDNSKNKEKILFEENAVGNTSAVLNAKRTHTIQIEYCDNVEIDGITIRDSLVYNIRPICCKNLKIKDVKIIGCWRYNSDGIDMHNCENVIIDNCFIRTFDDSICVKGFDFFQVKDVNSAVKEAMYHNGKVYDVFKNVLVKNCTIWNDWGKCLEIGAETKAEEIYDIIFENCNLIHVTGPVLDCYNIDYAFVHDVIYRDINVEYDEIIMSPSIQERDDEEYVNKNLNYSPTLINVTTDYHFEYSAGGDRRGKTHDIKFSNIHLFGKYEPKMYFKGYDEEHKTKDVTVENVFWNGELLEKIENMKIDQFAENIEYKINEFTQNDKNNVDSKNQLKRKAPVRFINENGSGKRIMFVGNSITLHGVKEDIGWFNEWGMAASKKENDYVHITASLVNQIDKDAVFCLCQVAQWEQGYKQGSKFHHIYEKAREFDADIIVTRFIENCPKYEFDAVTFKKEMDDLLSYLDKNVKAKFIITTGFWKNVGDIALRDYAKENSLPLIELGDLGEREDMKAIGLFEHSGVANHPGDLGMKNIAERIFDEIKKLIYSKCSNR